MDGGKVHVYCSSNKAKEQLHRCLCSELPRMPYCFCVTQIASIFFHAGYSHWQVMQKKKKILLSLASCSFTSIRESIHEYITWICVCVWMYKFCVLPCFWLVCMVEFFTRLFWPKQQCMSMLIFYFELCNFQLFFFFFFFSWLMDSSQKKFRKGSEFWSKDVILSLLKPV